MWQQSYHMQIYVKLKMLACGINGMGKLDEIQCVLWKQCVLGLNIKTEKINLCDSCEEGKHCRDSLSGTCVRAERPLERIHSDVFGPIDPTASDGSRCFLYRWLQLHELKEKAEWERRKTYSLVNFDEKIKNTNEKCN